MDTVEQLMNNNFDDIEGHELGWHSRFYMLANNKIGGMLTIVNKPKKVQCFIDLLYYVDSLEGNAYSSQCFGYGYSFQKVSDYDCENRAFALAVLTADENIKNTPKVFKVPLAYGIRKAAHAIETSPIYGWLNRNDINERCPLMSFDRLSIMRLFNEIKFIEV